MNQSTRLNTNRIMRLDEVTASKIAAGEVVEKPAMVVKELVENAVDAGATEIIIDIKKGGKKLIRVVDNGSGIHRDDVDLMFERHATSKIRKIDDLYKTLSLGFRGEALASICAVANVEVITMQESDDYGIKVEASGGAIVNKSEMGAKRGTSIVVRDLFYNTPARLKFLKSDAVETKHISEIMGHLALSHPEIAFKYTTDDQLVFRTPGDQKLENTIFSIYDRTLIKHLFEIKDEYDFLKLKGYISTFDYTKGTRQQQIVFVNGRYVKSDIIKDAIQLAYKPYLMNNRYPVCFLFLEIDPDKIDVNIHPAKTEIKFHDDGVLKQFIYTALKKAFNLQNQIPEVSLKEVAVMRKIDNPQTNPVNRDNPPTTPTQDPSKTDLKINGSNKTGHVTKALDASNASDMAIISDLSKPMDGNIDVTAKSVEVDAGDLLNRGVLPSHKSVSSRINEYSRKDLDVSSLKGTEELGQHNLGGQGHNENAQIQNNNALGQRENSQVQSEAVRSHIQNESREGSRKNFVARESVQGHEYVAPPKIDFSSVSLEPLFEFVEEINFYDKPIYQGTVYDELRYIGTFINAYLLCEKDNHLYLIDQHAAHEKIYYERYLKAYKDGEIISQGLLLPEIIELDHLRMHEFNSHQRYFKRLGFDVSVFGDKSIIVREIPNMFNIETAKDILLEIMDGLSDRMDDLIFENLMSRACRAVYMPAW